METQTLVGCELYQRGHHNGKDWVASHRQRSLKEPMQNTLNLGDLIPTLVTIFIGLKFLWVGTSSIHKYIRLKLGSIKTTGRIIQIRPRESESELIIHFKDQSDRNIEVSCDREGKFWIGDQVNVFYSASNSLDATVITAYDSSAKSLMITLLSILLGGSLVIYGVQRAYQYAMK